MNLKKNFKKITIVLLLTLISEIILPINNTFAKAEVVNNYNYSFEEYEMNDDIKEGEHLNSLLKLISNRKDAIKLVLGKENIEAAKRYLNDIVKNIDAEKDEILKEFDDIEVKVGSSKDLDKVKEEFLTLIASEEIILKVIDDGKKEEILELLEDKSIFGESKEVEFKDNGLSQKNFNERDKDIPKKIEEDEDSKSASTFSTQRINDINEFDYLKESIDTKFTESVSSKAEELGSNPLDIFNYVRNNIQFQPYYGSKKGATGTLEQYSGNDFDQSSLLIALLRKNNIPARYVVGQVVIKADDAKAWLGTDNATSAASTLLSAGIPCAYEQDKYVIVNHVWVEAYCDTNNYRGLGEDSGEKRWVSFDPSFKKIEKSESISVVDTFDVDTSAFEDFGVGIDRRVPSSDSAETNVYVDDVEEVIEYFSSDVKNNFDPMLLEGKNSVDVFGGYKIINENLEILPSSIPNEILKINRRVDELSNSDRDFFSISVESDSKMSGANQFKYAAVELYNKSITISWIIADEQSKINANAYGGMYNAPAYLINVKPIISVDGETVLEGNSIKLGTGKEYKMSLQYADNGNQEYMKDIIRYNTLFAGGYYTVGLNHGIISQSELEKISKEVDEISNSNISVDELLTEGVAGNLLDGVIKMYFAEQDTYNLMLSQEYDVRDTKFLSFGMSGFSPYVGGYGNTITQVTLNGMMMDIDTDYHSSISRVNNVAREEQYELMRGYISSTLEHTILQQFTNKAAVSTVEILTECNARGITIYTINKNNLSTILPKLKLDSYIVDTIKTSIQSGKEITIPSENIKYGDWIGTGWIIRDIETNSQGFMLSSGYAGGSTVESMADVFSDSTVLQGFIAGFAVGYAEGLVFGGIAGLIMGSLTFSCGAIGIMAMAMSFIGLVSDISYFTEIVAGCQSGEIPPGKAAFLIGEMFGQAIGSTFGAKIGGQVAGATCFTKGTIIKTEDGDKPIEEIKEGDLVYSKNNETGVYEYKRVINIFEEETNTILRIHVGDTIIETTEEHPFYVEDLGYLEADDLLDGYEVVLTDGTTQTIDKIERITLQNNVKVYNFEVEDNHNYFVSELGVLVHNGCSRQNIQRAKYKAYTGKDATGEVHHGFPEQFSDWFTSKGIDINSGEWYFDLTPEMHRLKSGNGIHTNNSHAGMTWNKAWEVFIGGSDDALVEDIVDEFNRLAKLFKIEEFRAVKGGGV